jgi:hypothetical protein
VAVVLIASENAEEVGVLAGAIESLGHTALPLVTTENIVEDVTLNDVRLVLLAEHLLPYTSYETCGMLREDPTVSPELPILMIVRGPGNARKLEQSGFTGTIDPDMSAAELSEEVVRQLGDDAVPEEIDPLAGLPLE